MNQPHPKTQQSVARRNAEGVDLITRRRQCNIIAGLGSAAHKLTPLLTKADDVLPKPLTEQLHISYTNNL